MDGFCRTADGPPKRPSHAASRYSGNPYLTGEMSARTGSLDRQFKRARGSFLAGDETAEAPPGPGTHMPGVLPEIHAMHLREIDVLSWAFPEEKLRRSAGMRGAVASIAATLLYSGTANGLPIRTPL